MSTATIGAWAALASSMTWAIASAQYARSARAAGTVAVALGRTLVIAPLFLVASLVSTGGADFAALDGRHLAWLALSTLCSFALGDLVFLGAARRIGVSRALALASIYPLWTAVIGVVVRGEHVGAWRAAGALLCVGGVVAIIRLGSERAEGEEADARQRATGVAMALGASLLWALNGLAVKEAAAGLSTPVVNCVRNAMAMVPLGAAWLWARRAHPRATTRPLAGPLTLPEWRRLLPAVIVDGVVGSWLFIYAFGHADLSVAAPLSSLAPLFALPAVLLVGDERFSLARSAAVAATVGGVVLIVANAT